MVPKYRSLKTSSDLRTCAQRCVDPSSYRATPIDTTRIGLPRKPGKRVLNRFDVGA